MPRVNVVCRNYKADRVIPRMARALAERLGWSLTAAPNTRETDALYLLAYFEGQRIKSWPRIPVFAYFTHREEQPPGNAKARLYDRMAERVQLRVATCRMYADALRHATRGPTVQVAPPLERDRFVIGKRTKGRKAVVGFSGYTYVNKRKGQDLAIGLLKSSIGQRVEWKASGRGWPVPTTRYAWVDMPRFYQGLDVLVATGRVEGIPMPPLEALACGVSVVVPRGVGILDELPQTLGIHRYECGDVKSLIKALGKAVTARGDADREALRAATEGYSVEAWCEDHMRAFRGLMAERVEERVDGGLEEDAAVTITRTASAVVQAMEIPAEEIKPPVEQGTGKARGIYCVAFGDPARTCALRLLKSIKKHMPDIPVALCSDRKIGPEDLLIVRPDSDVGGRRAKLKAYELSPAEWAATLYLDADTEVVAPIYRYFEWIEDGWELVICKDPHLMDTMHSFKRRYNAKELVETEKLVSTLHTLQLNGGVWAFGRSKRLAAFFRRWQAEWERHAQRDQGALIRALYSDPLRVLVLGNEWNTFPKYTKGIKTAGLMHYPGDARRWRGMIPGRIDSPEAWRMVRRFEGQQRGRRRR